MKFLVLLLLSVLVALVSAQPVSEPIRQRRLQFIHLMMKL
jgi:hypothetical protein